MAYTGFEMAANAEAHYRAADEARGGTPDDALYSIAESLCGLLAMILAHYAGTPVDDE